MADTLAPIAQYQSDHDLLVRLDERMEALTNAVEKKNDDHEGRIRSLERMIWVAAGVATAAGAAIGYALQIFL